MEIKAETTYIELVSVTCPNRLTLIPKLVEEQEPPQPILPYEPRQAHERKRSDAAERQLDDSVVRSLMFGVARGAREQEMRSDGDGDGEDEEHGPREARGPYVGLVDAHPSEVRPEALELVLCVGNAAFVSAAAAVWVD